MVFQLLCLIKFEGHQTFDQKLKTFLLFSCFMGAMFGSFGQPRTTLAQRLVSVFDQTCFNRLATDFNVSMFGHQTMFDGVWSPNISRLSRALDVSFEML